MPETRVMRVVMAGYGTVGRALHQILHDRRQALIDEHGIDFKIVGIARRERVVQNKDGVPAGNPNAIQWTRGTVIDLLRDVEADVFVELSPTDLSDGQPGLGHCRAAIHEGLPVVMANKGPVVAGYADLMARADKAGVPVRFEATVAGCVPTLNSARYGFAGDAVQKIEGILNGTTNFILTRMTEEGSDFDQALSEAQAMGYAEADPTADVDGLDAAAKVVILGNAVLGLDLTMDKVQTDGIRGVTRQAIELANAHGFHIKLVAEASRDGTARVGPRLVRKGDTIDVPGVLNAVRFTTDLAGPVTHIGHGAGGNATAAAVLSDLLDVARVTAP